MLSALRRHLYSSAGEPGIIDLLGRAQTWFGLLTEAWRSRNEVEGFFRLFNVLADAITALDSFDLRTQQIRLRPFTDGEIPVAVICKLARAWIEYLAAGDELAEQNAFESLAVAGRSGVRPREFERGFRAALTEFLIEKGDYELAVATIDKNLMVRSLCPYSQHLLYHALRKQREAGVIGGSSRIGLDDLSDRFCEQPFETISTSPPLMSAPVGGGGSKPVPYACSCAGMLPYPLARPGSGGNEQIEDIWNGPEAQEIRRSILEGDFTYCNRMLCDRLLNGGLPKRQDITNNVQRDIIDNKRTRIEAPPRSILLAHDVSCNLACPSCRPKILTAKSGARAEMDEFVDRIILPLLQDADVDLHVAGDGDPISSKHYRKLLSRLDPIRHSRVRLVIHSNGLLITPGEWESLSHIHHLIKGVSISIDAAEPTTYEDLRRPGKWATLTKNMEFLANLRGAGKISFLNINFVVQKKNYEQMPRFVELGEEWSVDRVLFSRLFHTLHGEPSDSDEFQANAVVDSRHPDHSHFLEVLKHPLLRSETVDLFNITSYLGSLSGGSATPSMTIAVDEPTVSNLVQAPSRKLTSWISLFRRHRETSTEDHLNGSAPT